MGCEVEGISGRHYLVLTIYRKKNSLKNDKNEKNDSPTYSRCAVVPFQLFA